MHSVHAITDAAAVHLTATSYSDADPHRLHEQALADVRSMLLTVGAEAAAVEPAIVKMQASIRESWAVRLDQQRSLKDCHAQLRAATAEAQQLTQQLADANSKLVQMEQALQTVSAARDAAVQAAEQAEELLETAIDDAQAAERRAQRLENRCDEAEAASSTEVQRKLNSAAMRLHVAEFAKSEAAERAQAVEAHERKLERQNEDLTGRIALLRQANEALLVEAEQVQETHAVRRQLADAQASSASMQSELARAKAACALTQDELQDMRNERQPLELEMAELKAKLAEAEQKCAELEAAHGRMRTDLAAAQAQVRSGSGGTGCAADVTTEALRNELARARAAHQADAAEMVQQRYALEGERAARKSDHEALENGKKALLAEQNARAAEREARGAELVKLQQRISAADTAAKTTREECSSQQAALAQMQEQLAAEKGTVEKLQQQCNSQRDQLERTARELEAEKRALATERGQTVESKQRIAVGSAPTLSVAQAGPCTSAGTGVSQPAPASVATAPAAQPQTAQSAASAASGSTASRARSAQTCPSRHNVAASGSQRQPSLCAECTTARARETAARAQPGNIWPTELQGHTQIVQLREQVGRSEQRQARLAKEAADEEKLRQERAAVTAALREKDAEFASMESELDKARETAEQLRTATAGSRSSSQGGRPGRLQHTQRWRM